MEDQSGNKGASSSARVYGLFAVCLVLGIACGYLVRGSAQPRPPQPAPQRQNARASSPDQPTPEAIKHMADKEAEPLLTQLKTKPDDPQLLASIGNVYYNAQIFPEAISYYDKSLRLKDDADIRTNKGTALFYVGDADGAIAEFERTLKAFPNATNALFDIGMVKWQARMDTKGALAAWEKLLKENPNHPRRGDVEQLIAQARQHSKLAAQKPAKGSM